MDRNVETLDCGHTQKKTLITYTKALSNSRKFKLEIKI